MIQVIERKSQADKYNITFPHGNIQISYNSDGHLVVRNWDGNDGDKLLVFDGRLTKELIKFIVKVFVVKEDNPLPF